MAPKVIANVTDRYTKGCVTCRIMCYFILTKIPRISLFLKDFSNLDWVESFRDFSLQMRRAAENEMRRCRTGQPRC